jgi:hypothetical protein
VKFYLYNGLNVILGAGNPVTGLIVSSAVSAFDNFLLDKLATNWTPSQYVEKELCPIVKGDAQ